MIQRKKIFLIDDSNIEAILLNHAIFESGKLVELESYTSSVEAFNELLTRQRNDVKLLPDLILLDLNMPGLNGIEFLKKMRRINTLNKLPILIFTSSDLDSDRVNCLKAGADSVIVKPSGIDKYKEVISTIYLEWLLN